MTGIARYPEITRTRWSSADEADRFTVDNPATGRPTNIIQGAGTAQVDQAVRTAHEAHLSWRQRPARERGTYLRKIADTLREHADELAELETREMGKQLATSRQFDLEAAITGFEYFAGLVEVLPSQARDFGPFLDVTTLEPYGVIGAIVPFNWPPIHTTGKIAPALAVGNAVVVKPPEQTPSVVLRMVELISQVLPDDVVHVVAGGGAVGAALVGHELVAKVSFTGSPATGAAVLKKAAGNLTPALMELGGKNPLLVFEDADLDRALLAAIDGGFYNQGEACTASSRLLVADSIYDEFTARLAAAVSELVVGDGAVATTEVGPMVTRAQQQRVLEYIGIGQAEGAKLLAQGRLPEDPELADGFFVAPTLFTDVTPDMRVANEEIFGPVVTVLRFRDEEEAVGIANRTPFGLVAGVYTRDGERSLRVSKQIRAGIVTVNNYVRATIGSPFGGVGASGFGREHATETLAEYGYSKTVRLATAPERIPAWDAAVRTAGL